jgi:hypothetical protein
MRCSVLRRMNPLVAPFSSGSSTHHFGSDWRKSGHSRRMLKPTRLTRICHRVPDFAVTHNATCDVVR